MSAVTLEGGRSAYLTYLPTLLDLMKVFGVSALLRRTFTLY